MTDLRDWCQYRACTQESDIIFLGVGLCDEHYTRACSTVQHITKFLPPRVSKEARAELQRKLP